MKHFIALLALSFISHTCINAIEYGAQSMVDPLITVLVKRPDTSFSDVDPLQWHYTGQPDLAGAQEEHDAFVALLASEGVEVIYQDDETQGLADSIFVHDSSLITQQGAIILRMGKTLRNGEENAVEQKLKNLGIPIYYRLSGNALAEGGDLLWLDEKTLLAGQGYRTNSEGLNQLKEALNPLGVNVIGFDLPYFEGKEACLHLQSLISLVDEKIAVVFKPLMAVNFIKLLEERGFQLIEVPENEFLSMGPNILCISPKLVLTIVGNPETKRRMEAAGITVLTYKGDEISLKAEGGATCLTRPLLRKQKINSSREDS